MTTTLKTIGRLPVNLGEYDSTRAYGKKNRVLLYGCEWESKVNNNTYAPAALNTTTGIITPDTTHWKLISGSYNTWLIDNGYQKMAASNVKDSNLNNTQDYINATIIGEIGSDSTPNTVKGRIKNLETNVGSGGSVDQRIAAAKNEVIGGATSGGNTLKKIEDRVSPLETAVGTGGSVDSRITSAVAPKANSADVYAKTETYTKEEVHNLITTPSQEYVSVIATDQTTSVTDVLPATGAADTTYRVGNWDGTQYNDSVFSEYAWNGSAYIRLSTKSQIGEVYDISANHADTKYADLAAALGTNGANIPQSLRKGGMSVKFIQSSDSKYVQYRLMSDTFNTTVTNWQGVDEEPTIGSDNMVKSGGVATAIHPIEDIPAPTVYTSDYWWLNAGETRTIATISALSESVKGWLKVIDGSPSVVEFCNSSWNCLYRVENVIDGDIVPVTIPKGVTKIIMYFASPASERTKVWLYIYYNSAENRIEALEEDNAVSSKEVEKIFDLKGYTTVIDDYFNIEAGQSKRLVPMPSAVSDDTFASILIKRQSPAKVSFVNSSYVELGKIENVQDGEWYNTVIPKGTATIIVVLSSTAVQKVQFDITLITESIENRLEKVEAKTAYLTATSVIEQNNNYFIPAGENRITTPSISNPLEYPIQGYIKITGLNAMVLFCASDREWTTVAKYILTDGVEEKIIIPSHVRRIIVYTASQEPVSESTPFHFDLYYSKELYDDVVISRRMEENAKYIPALQNMHLTKIDTNTGMPSTSYKTLVLASITDIHDNTIGAEKFLEFTGRYGEYLDDVIGLGDYQNGGLEDSLNINSINGWSSIIKAIGNHDAYTNWRQYGDTEIASEEVCYNTFLKDDIEDWGVEYTANKCYFYKDYDDAKIRVVFVDYMHYDSAQETWLRNILYNNNDSAYAKDYHVIVCVHSWPKSSTSGNIVLFENCSFETYDTEASNDFNSSLPDIINEFQTHGNGGNFICYLCGHSHRCFTGTLENYPTQTIIVQPCTAAFKYWRDSVFTWDTDYLKQYFIYSFDTDKQFIRVYNVGADFNRSLQHRESMLIEYGDTVKLLSCF